MLTAILPWLQCPDSDEVQLCGQCGFAGPSSSTRLYTALTTRTLPLPAIQGTADEHIGLFSVASDSRK